MSEIAFLIREKAASSSASDVTPARSRRQKERLRTSVEAHYLSLDELSHFFTDISSTDALNYFSPEQASLIKQAASGLADARRAIRRLADGSNKIKNKKSK